MAQHTFEAVSIVLIHYLETVSRLQNLLKMEYMINVFLASFTAYFIIGASKNTCHYHKSNVM